MKLGIMIFGKNYDLAIFFYRHRVIALSLVTTSMIIIGCSCQSITHKDEVLKEKKTSTGIIDSIPILIKTYPKSIEARKELLSSMLRLSSLESDSASFSVRVWFELIDTVHVITFSFSKKENTGSLITFGFCNKGDKEFLCVYDKKKSVQPRGGWKPFLDSTLLYNIIGMPDQSLLVKKKKVFVDGGDFITFQVSFNKKLRTYSFEQPSAYRKENRQSLNVHLFLNMIEREFGISTYSLKSY